MVEEEKEEGRCFCVAKVDKIEVIVEWAESDRSEDLQVLVFTAPQLNELSK